MQNVCFIIYHYYLSYNDYLKSRNKDCLIGIFVWLSVFLSPYILIASLLRKFVLVNFVKKKIRIQSTRMLWIRTCLADSNYQTIYQKIETSNHVKQLLYNLPQEKYIFNV